MSKAQHDIRRKLRVFAYAERSGNIRKTCRYFGIPVMKGVPCLITSFPSTSAESVL